MRDPKTIDAESNALRLTVAALREAGALDEAALARGAAAARGGESALGAAVRLGILDAAAYAGAAAAALGWRRLGAEELTRAAPYDGAGPEPAFLRARRIAVIADADGAPVAALADPFATGLPAAISLALGGAPRFAAAPAGAVEAWLDARLAPRAATGPGAQTAPLPESTAAPGPASEAVDALLETAARLGASDLHFEPDAHGGRARARVDGDMRDIGRLEAEVYPAAIARLKVLARLDVAERRLPQDGRARRMLAGRATDLRLSTTPTLAGESLAIRLLDPAAAPGRLDALGFAPDYLDVLGRAFARPHGLFVLTGPTGSGKTTTLHAALTTLSGEAVKIMTVEDPVEYEIPGAVQTQVHTEIGLDFARAQRTMLRHNPDIMMVGEIRDPESAGVAVQAALTGHLVLTTVHANTAAGAAIRLLNLGVEPFLLSAALIGAGAQRLARRLCPACRAPDAPPAEALARIGAPETGAYARAAGSKPGSEAGCETCGGTGVKGRVAIAEAFLADDAFREAIRAPGPSEPALAAIACANGSPPLHHAALALAARGEIALDEALRVAPAP